MTTYLNKDEISRIIYDNGLFHGTMSLGVVMDADHLERFAALVAEAEREKMKWEGIHTCNPDCQNPACVAVREAVAAEREECAKVCDQRAKEDTFEGCYASACAAAIRARGQ